MMTREQRFEAAMRMNPAFYIDIYNEFDNSPQLQWTVLTVVLNMLFTLAMWNGIYGMKTDDRFSEFYFLKSGSNHTTGSDIYDGMLNGFGTIAIIGVVSFIMLGFAMMDFRKIIKVWLTTSCLVILYGISGSTVYDLFCLFLNVHEELQRNIIYVCTFVLTAIYGTIGAFAFFTDFSLILHQFYVITNCSLIATFYLRIFPGNTTWFVLWIVSAWDVFAVMAPIGPLRKVQEKAADYSTNVLKLLMFTADEKRRSAAGCDDVDADVDVGQKKIKTGVKELIQHYSKKEAQDMEFVQKIRDRRKGINPESSNVSENSPIVESPEEPVEVLDDAEEVEEPEEVGSQSDDDESTSSGNSEYASTEEGEEMLDEEDCNTCDEAEEGELEVHRKERTAADALNDGESIRLGFGDFVFYSLLIGTAATGGNFLATLAAGFGVVLGLVITLTVLSTPEETTPALPMSVLLGTVTYFYMNTVLGLFNISFEF